MSYANEDFSLRDAKTGDGALIGYLNAGGEPKFVTEAVGLPVAIVSGGGGGGGGGAVEGVAASGSAIAGIDPVLIGGVTSTSLPGASASNLLKNVLVDEYGRLVINLRDNSGNDLLTSGIVVQLGATGTGATSLGKAEDAAHTTGDAGVMMLGVRNDAAASQTSANGDYGAPSLDAAGRQFSYGGPVEEIVGTASTVTTLTNLSAVDCYAAGYTFCMWTYEIATGTGTVACEISNDNVNWRQASSWSQTNGLSDPANSWNRGNNLDASLDFLSYVTPIEAKYIRWRMTATSGGVTTVRAGFSRSPIPTSAVRTLTNIATSLSSSIYVQGSTNTFEVIGDVAHDAVATSSSPVLVGNYAYDTLPANVSADGDSVRSTATRAGQRRTVTDINATQVGWTPLFDSSITNTVESLKASAGVLGQIALWNTNANDAYLQLFNLATGSVTLGTTTPTAVYPIKGGTTNNPGLTIIDVFASGIQWSTAISYAVTTTATGSAAVTTPLAGTFLYK